VSKFLRFEKDMAQPLKYIIDDPGEKTSVLAPIKICEELNINYQKLQKKLNVFKSIEQGLKEVKSSRKSARKLQALKEFLKA
jgi:hypothetical protein